MSEGLEGAVASAVTQAPHLYEDQVHEIVRECGARGYSLDRIADHVKACVYVGFGPTSEGAVRADLNISPELFKACIDLLGKQGLVGQDPASGKYSWTWKGLFSRNYDWSWSAPWRIGLLYALAEKDIPNTLVPPGRYRDITFK